MLGIEEIKKGCEFADEFKLHRNLCGGYLLEYNGDDDYRYVLESNDNLLIYKLFLQRVIEGIKYNYPKKLLSVEKVAYEDKYYFSVWNEFRSDGVETIDQAKEQAIKYILEKL